MTRRTLLLGALSPALTCALPAPWPVSVEGYIFQQYAERRKKPLADVLDEVIPFARGAGYRNVELSDAFFTPALRERVIGLLGAQGLNMPSVYVGGALHEAQMARVTIGRALETAEIGRSLGCRALVTNPDPKPGGAPKSDAELVTEAESLNRLGDLLQARGVELRVHHHTPQLENHAREWRFLLSHTDPNNVHLCVDVDWAYESGFEATAFLREAGLRVRELHVRSARNRVWLEDVEDGDVDYHAVAAYLREAGMRPHLVVELAYRPETRVTRTLQRDLEISRQYVERVFGTGRT